MRERKALVVSDQQTMKYLVRVPLIFSIIFAYF